MRPRAIPTGAIDFELPRFCCPEDRIVPGYRVYHEVRRAVTEPVEARVFRGVLQVHGS